MEWAEKRLVLTEWIGPNGTTATLTAQRQVGEMSL